MTTTMPPTQQQLAEQIGGLRIHIFDGEEVIWTGSALEFIESNQYDQECIDAVCELLVGASERAVGGGAAPEYILARAEEVAL